MEIKMLDINDIKPNPLQPREHFDRDKLQELADSLKSVDLLFPISVRPKDGRYEIISGERRWKAAQIAGFKKIAAIVKTDIDNIRLMLESLIENTHREDLSALERAKAIRNVKRAIEKEKGKTITYTELGKILGLNPQSIEEYLSVLPIEKEIRHAEKASSAVLPIAATRSIAKIESKPIREKLLKDVAEGKRTASQIEDIVPIIKKASAEVKKAIIREEIEPETAKVIVESKLPKEEEEKFIKEAKYLSKKGAEVEISYRKAQAGLKEKEKIPDNITPLLQHIQEGGMLFNTVRISSSFEGLEDPTSGLLMISIADYLIDYVLPFVKALAKKTDKRPRKEKVEKIKELVDTFR